MEHTEPLTVAQLAELRQEHIGRLLLRANRSFSERALRKLRERGHARLSLVHTTVLAQLDINGTQATVLAERVGITKQAVGQIVSDLEREGYIQRIPDPTDKRATTIIFTDAGWQFLVDAYHVKKEIEAEYVALLGEEHMQQLRSILQILLEDRAI
ncbi:MAG TPA: MarR family transcriptional regulator [Ktedonobacteraceae bacterium]|nr:MarR family transcriptional regulator [Ktedonobacteraceae bacterium]